MPFFHRTANGAEIDLIFERGGKPSIAVDVKRSSAPKIEPGFIIACNETGDFVEHRDPPAGQSLIVLNPFGTPGQRTRRKSP